VSAAIDRFEKRLKVDRELGPTSDRPTEVIVVMTRL